MAKTNSDNGQAKNDEFSRIFDEYRAKIDEITRRTDKNLQQAEAPSDSGSQRSAEPSVVVIPNEQVNLNNSPNQVERAHDKTAEKIVEEAKREARRIIDEAEENVKKEAKKKTQSKVDKIIEKARKDSEDIVSSARQAAEREKEDIAVTSKREAETIIKTITDEYRAEARTQSEQVIAQARETAEEILADIISSSTKISQHIVSIVNRAKDTINELEKSLQSEMDELNTIIAETQARMDQVANTNVKKTEEKPVNNKNNNDKKERKPASESDEEQLPNETDLFVKFKGEKTNGDNGTSPLFSGQMELKAVSSFEYKQIRSIKNHLVSIPNIKYMQEYASEKEMSVLFEIKEPLPLLDIFNGFPQVDKVASVENGITLTLKNHS